MNVAEVVDDILSHHGVKGMRWGVRQRVAQATGRAGPQKVTVKPTISRRGIKAKGGAGHPAHPEAISAQTIGQIGRKSGVKALSNKQLQEYNQRLNLEQNAKRLSGQDRPLAEKFVRTLLGKTGQNTIQNAGNEVAAHQVRKKLVKAGLVATKAAAAAA